VASSGYEPSVLLYTAPSGGAFVAMLPKECGWKRSIRRQGGFWQGSATIRGDDVVALCDAFQTWLGYYVRERTGGKVTWEGLVYELELTIGQASRRRSLNDMANAVTCTYQSGGVVATTAYSTQAQSIARFGRKEEMLLLDNYPLATAEAYRSSFLAERSWPWPRPLGLGARGKAQLNLLACGYVYTANWMFVEEGDGTDDDVDDWMAQLVGTTTGLSSNHGGSTAGAGDCQFLKVGSMGTNTLQVTKSAVSPVRAWDVMSELAQLGDADGDAWRVWVGPGQLVYYWEQDLTPRYFMRDGVLYDTPGARDAVNPWSVRPGVVRDMDYPARQIRPQLLLSDARDALIEEVEVDEAGNITLRPESMMESGVLAAQYQEYEAPGEDG